MFSSEDQFCPFWDQFCRFAYIIRLGDHFCLGITFAAVQFRLVESGIYVSKHYRSPATPSDAYVLVAQMRVGCSLACIGPGCPWGMGSSINKNHWYLKVLYNLCFVVEKHQSTIPTSLIILQPSNIK